MWRKFLQWVMDHRPTKLYRVGGDPLFYRAYLFTLFGRVWYLHHYLRSDPDGRGWHDHPMRAWALILAGGYVEERVAGLSKEGLKITTKRFGPGRVNRLGEHVFHRVVIPKRWVSQWRSMQGGEIFEPIEVQPTSWSLFVSRYVPGKSWGFLRAFPKPARKVPNMDHACDFRYEEAGPGIDDEDPWWKTAPNGKFVREST